MSLFGEEIEYSPELEIYDELPDVRSADVALSLYRMNLRDGMNPVEALRGAIEEIKTTPVPAEDLE